MPQETEFNREMGIDVRHQTTSSLKPSEAVGVRANKSSLSTSDRASETGECDLFAVARDAVGEHSKVRPLGLFENRQKPFVPASWPQPFPSLCRGKGCDPTWWLALWFDTIGRSEFGLCLMLSPMTDQQTRLRIVERLLRDPSEFGLLQENLINNPGVPTQWVYLDHYIIASKVKHGLKVSEARQHMDDAISDYVDRFARVGDVLAPLWKHV